MVQIATKKFTSELVMEYSSTPESFPMGTFENEMTLHTYEDGSGGVIEWYFFNDDEDGCEHIGLEFEGKSVIGYDGVFEIPKQAIQLLKECGYDCDAVEELD